MTGLDWYIIFRAVTYLSVGGIAFGKRIYSVTALLACMAFAALTPEIFTVPILEENLKHILPLAVLWVGWDLIHTQRV